MRVYVVQEQSSIFGTEEHHVWVYDSEDKAKQRVKTHVEEFEKYNLVDSNGYYIDRCDSLYECYLDGSYNEFNYAIWIDEREVL